MFSRAVQRLAGVTQILSPMEGFLHHSRLTHTLEMAQLGRRLSQLLNDSQETHHKTKQNIDPDIVEAACLVHDTGHPPFGHAGEVALDQVLTEYGCTDGYEGNAQSLRIIHLLEPYRLSMPGLNLMRITLNASIKYPWPRSVDPSTKEHKKWGVYGSEHGLFAWCKEVPPTTTRSVEASVMDIADDIIYSIHDLIDFSVFGLVPVRQIAEDGLFYEFMERQTGFDADAHPRALERLNHSFQRLPANARHTREELCGLRQLSSDLIKRFRDALQVVPRGDGEEVSLFSEQDSEIWVLKRIANHYIHNSALVVNKQTGQIKAIKDCFRHIMDRALVDDFLPLPEPYRSYLREPNKYPHLYSCDGGNSKFRIVADFISGLTDDQLISLHKIVSGVYEETRFRFM
jgi:dGTPase